MVQLIICLKNNTLTYYLKVVNLKRFKIFFLNSILIVVSSFILQIIRLVFNIYVSKKISSEALGVFGLIMATYYFGITLATSGINISCIKVVSEELAFCNYEGVKNSSKKCIKISILLSLIASSLFYVYSDIIVKYCFHYQVSKSIISLICIALPLISVSSAITGYFIAVRRPYKTVLGQFFEQISKLLSTIFLFNIFKPTLLHNICFILILCDVISEVVSFVYLTFIYYFDLKKYYSNTTKILSINFHKKIFKILIPVALTSYIKSGISTLKQLIIPSSINKSGKNINEALSEYGKISGMAIPIIMFPSIFLIAVSSLIIPEFSRYHVKKDYTKIKKYTDKLLISSFIFSLFLSFIFFIFANKISVFIYHRIDITFYVKILSLLIPFTYLDIVIDNILKGLNKQTIVMIINIIDLVFSTIFILIFVPKFGIKAYIISIFLSEIINLILSLFFLLKLEKKLD